MSFLILLVLSFSAFAEPCAQKEELLLHKFIPTPVGSWTVDESDALKVFREVTTFKLQDAKAKITKLAVHSCVANVPLETKNLTFRKEELAVAHLKKAEERRDRIRRIYDNEKPAYELILGHSACGPEFLPQDKNLRWKVVVPGEPATKARYEEAMASVLGTPGILEEYKKVAGLNTEAEIRAFNPNPFLVKYGAFNGYQMKIFGIPSCSKKSPVSEPKPASGRIQ